MSHSGHAKYVCEHGIVVRQCRCASPGKKVITVPCPAGSIHLDKVAELEEEAAAHTRPGAGPDDVYREMWEG